MDYKATEPSRGEEEGAGVLDNSKKSGLGCIDVALHQDMRNRLVAVVLLDEDTTKDEDG